MVQASDGARASIGNEAMARRITLLSVTYRLEQLRLRMSYAARAISYFARLRLQSNGERPPIALVVVGRNDDYTPDFAQRLRATIEWHTRHLVSEVIFVEWNPPADRELLSPELAREFPGLRAYIVSPEIHQALCSNAQVPLLEFHAKNVGLRRARSEWVITTNADAVFGMDTIYHILHAPLSEMVAWTAQRIEVPCPDHRSDVALLDFLRYQRINPYSKFGTGEFHLASRQLWEKVRGYDESLTGHRWHCDTRGIAQMLAHGAEVNRAGVVLHYAHPTSSSAGPLPHHGDGATLDGLPYQNADNWGMSDGREVELSERIWRVER